MSRRARRSPTLLALLALPACQAPRPAAAPPTRPAVPGHFALAVDLRTFAVSGDLERLRVTASALAVAEETADIPPGGGEYVAAVRRQAERAARAERATDATWAVANLVGACGNCHLAYEVDLAERLQAASPTEDDGSERHRSYLSWVSRLLWNGIVGPSDRSWSTAGGALAGEDGFPPPAARHVPEDVVARAAAELREIGEAIVLADGPSERTRVLSRAWDACAECHMQAGVR